MKKSFYVLIATLILSLSTTPIFAGGGKKCNKQQGQKGQGEVQRYMINK